MSEATKLDQAKKALRQMQEIDVTQFPRPSAGGVTYNFDDAVVPAKHLVALYKQMPIDVLDVFPENEIEKILARADNDYAWIQAIQTFIPNPTTQIKILNGRQQSVSLSPQQIRDSYVKNIIDAYQMTFSTLLPYIAFSIPFNISATSLNLKQKVDAELQTFAKNRTNFENQHREWEKEINGIITTVRDAAGQQGVSPQAKHFNTAAVDYQNASQKWLVTTIILTLILVLYAISTLFLHKWLDLSSCKYEHIQLSVSKFLIFATISSMLFLSAKNYLANRHNAVVNRHRQNALATFQTLVEAAILKENRDVVLSKAADCIFTAQPTAFSKFEGVESANVSLVKVAESLNPLKENG